MPSTTIGQRIKELRKHYKLNQTAFGKPVGVSYGHISNIESGKDNPSDNLVRLISIEYCVNENWIKTGEGEMLAQTFTQDHLSQNDSITDTIQELSEILNTSPVSIRVVQLSILYSVLNFLKGNSQIKKDKELAYLEILNEMIHQIVRYDLVLQVTCQRKLTKLDEKKIEETQEDVFGELARLLPYFEDLYKNK